MTKRDKEIYRQYRNLNRQGWNIEDTSTSVKFNGGSETLRHRVAKTVAASVCVDTGYRVASEVETNAGGEADILAFGLEERRPIVLELEKSLSETVKAKKIEQYNVGNVSEVWVIDLDNAPQEPVELYDHIRQMTGL